MTDSAPEGCAPLSDTRAATEALIQRARAELHVLDAVPDGGASYTQALLSDMIDRLQFLTERVMAMTGERSLLGDDASPVTASATDAGTSR